MTGCLYGGRGWGGGLDFAIFVFDAEVFDFFVQRIAVDAKKIGGFDFYAVAAHQGFFDQGFFDLAHHQIVNLAVAQFKFADGLIGQAAGHGVDAFAGGTGPALLGEGADGRGQQIFGKSIAAA